VRKIFFSKFSNSLINRQFCYFKKFSLNCWQKQIENNLGKGVFTPNFELEYEKQLKNKLF
jgi:hypothetical protein